MIRGLPRRGAGSVAGLVPRRAARAALIAIAGLALALGGPAVALAHDDPPGHYLETDLLYPAFGDRPSQAAELQLLGLLQASRQAGYPIKVALVANETDVEDATMVDQPQAYADRISADIALELGRPVPGPLLVISPAGYGIAGREMVDGTVSGVTAASRERLLAGLALPGRTGEDLARAAIPAVRQIAQLGGHELPASVPPASAVYEPPVTGIDLVPFVLFGLLFVPAWLAYETFSRRRASAEARATARAAAEVR